ncbi:MULTISPECIES: carbohydrate porin [Bradyrhizobium]|uniref:carbohydrate porin n=1 Tax=Bradyrhizobium TaxID=374 RepID=UPI000231CF9D|nr:carbohydrate porin [Bradyrhizobium japonicum]AJA63834.1 porin [Bradyrhizobium japonicum]KMJ96137.1 porin [Bradyrhizobium japonicum]MBR0760192.1 carbohydrate porin [Bradyrhizobium japonicum]MCS3539395.1 porin [Bradyrhizobium japonicum]MCS3993402.1 porin [Bradyrhizobium japonicum]
MIGTSHTFALRNAAAIVLAATAASTGALAGAKDESAAEWLAPKWFNEWHDGLANKGLNFGATYIADNIANVSGGVKRGAIHFGRLDLSVDADLDKLVGWTGGRFYANAFVIYGQGLSRNYVMNLATISEIEALPDQRLYNAYFEQSFFGDRLNIRAGQQAADVEFFDSQTDDLFINGTFGWPAIKASNLPAGGPAPPIAVPGIRIKAALTENITAFGAVFNGDPSGPGEADPQLRDHHGLAFRVNDPPWVIGQVRLNYDIDIGGRPLAGNFTPGAWKHYGSFDSQRFTAEGLSIADPGGSGVPARLRGNYGIFAIIEQVLYRPPEVKDNSTSASLPGITAFGRIAYSPPDRNLIDLYVDGGIGFVGFTPGRPLDRFGVAMAYMRISNTARNLDLDTQAFTGIQSPVRSNETLIEMIYEAHIKPGWLIAPYFQYVFRPSGGIPNPNDPTGVSRIGDAAVFGVTTTIRY